MSSWSDNTDSKFFKDPHIDIFKENRLVDIFKRIKKTGDDRSRSLLVNLILENQVDILLGHLIKKYKKYLKEAKPSFNNKLWLLHSFDMIPDQVYLSIDCLREIRNRFAHNLAVDRFSDLDNEIKTKIEKVILHTTFEKGNENSIEKKVYSIEVHAIVGLENYEPNLRLLSEQIYSKQFKELLETEYRKKIKEQHKFIDEWIKSRKDIE
jgi:hypothetical protein